MRIAALLLVPAISLAVGCNPEEGGLTQAETDLLVVEVAETLDGMTEAMNSHDPDRVAAYFRQSEKFLYLGCTDFMLGWETFSPRLWSYTVANPYVTFQREPVSIQILSPTAAVAALRGSSTEADALFWTEVLVKEDGSWRIAQEHESWPGCPPPSVPHPFTSMEEMTEIGAADTITSEGGAGGS